MTNYKRLHLFRDEKIVNSFVEIFEEVFPNENLYVVISSSKFPVHVIIKENILFLNAKSHELNVIIKEINSFEQIIFHSIWIDLVDLFETVSHPCISWVVWGADLYEMLLYRKGYQLYADENTIYKVRAKKWPLFLYKLFVKKRDLLLLKRMYRLISKLSYIYAEKCDYKQLLIYYPEFRYLNRKYLYYYPIEKMLGNILINKECSGYNVWINNCAGINGNHVCLFNELNRLDCTSDVIVPLSYGDTRYAQYVLEKGHEILGLNFKPLTDFISKEEYYSLFLSSNVFLFGHYRQCAFGNILIAIYLGGKVFFYEKNPLLEYFKSMGLYVYSIDNELKKEDFLVLMEPNKRMQNRQIIASSFSTEYLLSLLKTNFS